MLPIVAKLYFPVHEVPAESERWLLKWQYWVIDARTPFVRYEYQHSLKVRFLHLRYAAHSLEKFFEAAVVEILDVYF